VSVVKSKDMASSMFNQVFLV